MDRTELIVGLHLVHACVTHEDSLSLISEQVDDIFQVRVYNDLSLTLVMRRTKDMFMYELAE